MTEKQLPKDWHQPERPGFLVRIRGYAIAGLIALAPIFLTISILMNLVQWLDGWLVHYIPAPYRPENWLGIHIPGTGLVAGLILLVIVGMLVKNVAGRWLMNTGERLMKSIPGVRGIYSAIKQITDTLSMSQSDAFREVVLIEYPRKGLYAIAFVTGKTTGQVQKITDGEMVNIFVPTTPNPTSGFFLFIPKKDLISLNMTVEQGLKMVISAGIVTPSLAEGKAALKQTQTS